MSDESNASEPDVWQPFHFFLGTWRGSGTGKPGHSQVTRTYALVLQDRFIQVQDKAVYPPQERNPNGEIHEELGMFSFDEHRNKYVLREFHVEGFVNQYILQDDPDDRRLVFVSEAIENLEPRWRARTTYEILNENHFRETFDLAGPGKPWACFITIEFERAKGD